MLAQTTHPPGGQAWHSSTRDRVVKFNLRPAGLANVNRPVLGIWDGTKELPNVSGNEKIDLSKDWTLRIRIEGQTLHFEAKPSGRPVEELPHATDACSGRASNSLPRWEARHEGRHD